jgi:hypothetical protein
MSVLRFDIRYPNGHREVAVVEGERALLGSASYCDIRFPVDQSAYEHVIVEVLGGGNLRAVAKAHNPPATINGMPLTSSPLGPDSVLGIGVVQVFVQLVSHSIDGVAVGAEKKKGEGSPIIRLLGLILIPAAAYMLLMDDDAAIPAPPTQIPALFSSATPACPQAAPPQALALATENMDIAEGKRERHPFAPSQGVAAIELYKLSAACFRVARAEGQAKEAEAAGRALENTVTADFRTRRIRLEHMLKVQDYELAQKDVIALQTLTAGKRGPYVQWLATLAEDLKRKVAK